MKKNRPLFINLTRDIMFKTYFKKNKTVLKSLLQTFLPLPKDHAPIQHITVLDSFLSNLNPEEKNSIMDIRVQLGTGELLNVEMQTVPHPAFTERILLYQAKNYSSQLKSGQKYEKLCASYSLIFSTFDIFPAHRDFYNSFSIRSDRKPHFPFNGDLRLVTVELGKFRKREVEDLVDFREKWCYLLKESSFMGEEEGRWFSRSGMEEAMSHLKELSREEQFRILEEAKEKNWRDEQARMDHAKDQGFERGLKQGMEEAMSHLRELSREEQFRILEEAKEKNWRDEQARIDHATNQGLQKGLKQGIEQGIEQGLERGLKQGLKQGMKQKKQMVIRMLQNGLNTDLVSKISGLSKQEINALKEDL